jgi:hypothetical protein
MRPIVASLLAAAVFAPAAAGDLVVPSGQVRSRVVVRESPAGRGHEAGSLRPGQAALHLGTEGDWHRIRLDDGTTGFVSARWTRIVAVAVEKPRVEIPVETIPPAAIRQWRSSPFARLKGFLLGLFGAEPDVHFDIRDPQGERSVYRHTDPDLPVSGFARAAGAGIYDVVLVLDTSGSTNESARSDVDHDGRVDASWMGADSIYRAQISAALSFLRTLERLPENRGGERIRVGIVRYAGDERYRLWPADRDFPLEFEALLALAERDAALALPLTHDYAEAERVLRELWLERPVGMTDVAAGIARAVVELRGERPLEFDGDSGGDTDKVILFLTDGKPRLPYDKLDAERVATYAGKLASQAGVRIHAFALGYDAVSRSPSYSLRRMARRSGGRYVALASPGEIVGVLRATPLSPVDRVQLKNRTTGRESRHIATGIDGSFYGEIPLARGTNEIEVAAIFSDDRRVRRRLVVEYVPGEPTEELARRLERLRQRNEALLEQIRSDLVHEMERRRRDPSQERRLRVGPDAEFEGRSVEVEPEPAPTSRPGE